MFGYVKPCIMELKVKDYEKFKAYYCGLCKSIKNNFGEIPRLSLNYDMTFLGILIDSLNENKRNFKKEFCIIHPVKKRLILQDNSALKYAAFCNIILSYYKLVDDFNDDKNIFSKYLSSILKKYFKRIPENLKCKETFIQDKLKELYYIENNPHNKTLDEFCHPFSDLTGFIISEYFEEVSFKDDLYWLGYNLGKWIYLIDAFDDLENDMCKNKFNPINSALNNNNMIFEKFSKDIEKRIDFTLVRCAQQCSQHLNNLPLNKNKELLHNILNYGLMEKMDTVFKRSDFKDDKSL
ncbi:DUF5685 family protein [Haloimpatiens sp. FM7330]|uniref:DUF5685 family protein n=1 Tax=Haloimpatiens sp. FM7330 TaxID=3298610 RepID=UPI003624CE96